MRIETKGYFTKDRGIEGWQRTKRLRSPLKNTKLRKTRNSDNRNYDAEMDPGVEAFESNQRPY